MDNFYHSDDAENIIHMFYDAKVMVYVEGIDDVPFWEVIFNRLVDYPVEVQDVGGSKELQKYTKKVIDKELNAIIACDSDFEILKGEFSHENIISTYGYAIENSLISSYTIEKVVKSIGKLSLKNTPKNEIKEWFLNFSSAVEKLIFYDIYNELGSHGISVVGDNCSKFLKSKKSCDICVDKVNDFINNAGIKLEIDDVNTINEKVNSLPRNISDFIRGHFLFSAVVKFVSTIIKQINSKVSISNDAFFGSLLLAFENSFNATHPHYSYYDIAIKNINIAA